MTAEVAAGEWARHESPMVRVQQGRTLSLAAELRPYGAAHANIGIEFTGTGEEPIQVQALSAPLREGGESHIELVATVPAGFEQARAFVTVRGDAAGDGGGLDFDDVSLVPSTEPSPALAIDEYKLYAFGAGKHYSGCLAKVARVFLSRIEFAGAKRRVVKTAPEVGISVLVEHYIAVVPTRVYLDVGLRQGACGAAVMHAYLTVLIGELHR